MLKFFVFTLIALFYIKVNSRLAVYSPQTLIEQFSHVANNITYKLAKFGDIPFGKKMIAPLIIGYPEDGCSSLKEYNSEQFKINPFIMVYRGNCSFVKKASNIQAAGGKMAIIVDNYEQTPIEMQDDGTGFTVEIPSIMITNIDGDTLANAIKKGSSNYPEVHLVMEFDPSYVNTSYHFILSTPQPSSSFEFVQRFADHIGILGNEYTFQPYYQLHPEVNEEQASNNENQYLHCLGGGLYCSKSRENVMQILQALCIYKINSSLWWKFNVIQNDIFTQTYQSKSDIANLTDIYQQAIEKLQINETNINACINNSFVGDVNMKQELKKNNLLSEQLEIITKFKAWQYPSVIINDRLLNGGPNPFSDDREEIRYYINELCNGLKQKTDDCVHFIHNYQQGTPIPQKSPENNSYTIFILLLIIIILVLIFFIVAYLYRRSLKIYYSEQSEKVDEMVSAYIKLHSSNTKKSDEM